MRHRACSHAGPLEARLKPDDDLTGKAKGSLSTDDAELAEADLTEQRMRRALGLDGSGARHPQTLRSTAPQRGAPDVAAKNRPRHEARAAPGAAADANGLSPLQHRVAELQEQLRLERQRHEEARRLLQRAELAVRDAETRLQHDTLSRQDELAAVRQGAVNAQRALDETLFEAQERTEARRAAVAKEAADANPGPTASNHAVARPPRLRQAEAAGVTGPVLKDATPTPPKKRGRPRTRPVPEAKPVRWWTPSYKAKSKS